MVEKSSFQAFVEGHVQGVSFRAFVLEKAELLDLKGYVRNLPTGEVEVHAEGSKAKLESLLIFLKKGPPASRVDEVKIQWSKYRGKYSHFMIMD